MFTMSLIEGGSCAFLIFAMFESDIQKDVENTIATMG